MYTEHKHTTEHRPIINKMKKKKNNNNNNNKKTKRSYNRNRYRFTFGEGKNLQDTLYSFYTKFFFFFSIFLYPRVISRLIKWDCDMYRRSPIAFRKTIDLYLCQQRVLCVFFPPILLIYVFSCVSRCILVGLPVPRSCICLLPSRAVSRRLTVLDV